MPTSKIVNTKNAIKFGFGPRLSYSQHFGKGVYKGQTHEPYPRARTVLVTRQLSSFY